MSKRPRLIILNENFPIKVGEPFLKNEIDILKNDFDITLFPLLGKNKADSKSYFNNVNVKKCNITFSVKVLSFLMLFFDFNIYKEIFLLLKSRKLNLFNIKHLLSYVYKSNIVFSIVSSNIDLEDYTNGICFYSYWLYYQSYSAIRLSKKYKNSKVISRAHGFDLYEERNYGKYIPLRKYIISNMDQVFPISNNGLHYLSKKYPNKKNDFSVSRLGTKNNNVITRKKDNSITTILSCSSIVDVKRLELIPEVLKSIKTKEIRWIHIGDGVKKQILMTAISDLDSNIHVDLLGYMNNEEVLNYYNSNYIDLFINVSSSEGIPVSIMEAISQGIPVIATDVGGTSEIVLNDINGKLIDVDFVPTEVAKIIEDFTNYDNETINYYRINSFELWNNKFEYKKNYTDFSKKIMKLLK